MSAPMSFEAWFNEAATNPAIPDTDRSGWARDAWNARQPEIDALKAELAKAKDALDAAYQLGATWQEGKAIEIEQDAARYRFLRVDANRALVEASGAWYLPAPELDAAIDAAAQPKGSSVWCIEWRWGAQEYKPCTRLELRLDPVSNDEIAALEQSYRGFSFRAVEYVRITPPAPPEQGK